MAQIKKQRTNFFSEKKALLNELDVGMSYLSQHELTSKLVNRVLKRGKKNLAYKIVHLSMLQLKEITKQNPIEILEKAVLNASPTVEVKAKRIGGAVYQVPLKVARPRAQTLALRWILQEINSKSRKSIILNLSNAILEASKGSGMAIRKKEECHRAAEANRAFL
uniref:ribosomal protein S7 n=1 Tax=Cephaleuros virescens TaxID=173371 RepID=UPI001EDF06DA|nr:ribosomal protein S7 [Cephaleuros virescens]UIB38680.1 ribosomal protein S7 [Cephaleuros virescens]